MAFGFGFNKQKVLSAAEKFVQQGKLQNAIAEYDKVLKNDAKDLTVNNTIGDLYARLGDIEKAVECFKKVGDAYAAQGFTVKGIAMYKKITKLQPSVDSSLKLAELYTQQGLFNDARAQYLQVADDFMKNGDFDQAVRIFQKVLEMDPENVPMRIKLAEVYVKLGKKKEAWDIYSAVAELLRSRGSLAAADDILNGMMALDPGNSYVLLMRGKFSLENGDPKTAVGFLEKAADLDSHPEGLRDLLRAYLQLGNAKKAAPIAEKLLAVHNDPEGLFLLAEGCTRLAQYHDALDVYSRHADRLLATDSTKLLASLHTMITHVRDDSSALDALLLLLNKAGESTHVNEVTELLAHASVEDGNLARARDLYQMLSTTEPQNPLHLQNYQQVVNRMTQSAPVSGITAEEGSLLVDELEATAPVIDQSYPDDIAIAVRSAVTDADLFLSYNLPDKAVVPLLGALPKAPTDARLNQRLAALHTRFHRFAEAAVCCRTLEAVYHEAGCPDEAVRYGDLAARYEQTVQAAPASPATLSPISPAPSLPLAASAASSATAPSAPAAGSRSKAAPSAPARETAPDHPEFAIPEMSVHAPLDTHDHSADLASEWEHSLSVDREPDGRIDGQIDGQISDGQINDGEISDGQIERAHAAASAHSGADADASADSEIGETVEEIRFYCEHFMMEQARAAMEKLETLTTDAHILDPMRAALAASLQLSTEPEPEVAELEINADLPEVESPAIESPEIDNSAIESQATDSPEIESPAVHAAPHSNQPADFEVAMDAEPTSEPTRASSPIAFHGRKPHHEIPATPKYASPDLAPEPEPVGVESASAETVPAAEIALPSFVAELEASLGDSFPVAAPVSESPAAGASATGQLPRWPAAAAPPSEAPRKSKRVPLEAMAPAAHDLHVPTSTPLPATPASIGGAAATAAAPALAAPLSAAATPSLASPAVSYGLVPERPLGAGAQAMHPAGGIDLSQMFGELKMELEEEVAAGDDDAETHYNLGVAFREMGLLDEAIAEFQKVCNIIDRGKAFSQQIQTYTWLAQCFLDKGVPEAAIRWYEKALGIPGLDREARMAINYELGSACESAQDKPAALRHFTDVYGANIDYRDVAERIQALKS
ncbi:MAG: tetratricopeptide repeat protein [Terriglobales bacterium]